MESFLFVHYIYIERERERDCHGYIPVFPSWLLLMWKRVFLEQFITYPFWEYVLFKVFTFTCFYEKINKSCFFFIYLNFADFPWGCFTAGIIFTRREMCLLVRTVVQGSWNQCDIVMITVMSNLGHYWLNARASWFWLFLGNWLKTVVQGSSNWKLTVKLLSKALPIGNWLKTVVQGSSNWKLTENCCARLFQLEIDWKLLSKALPIGNWLKTVVQGSSNWKLTENCCPRLFQLETDWKLLSKALPISMTLSWLQSCLIQDTADFMHEIHDSGSFLEIDLWKQLFEALPINVTVSWL